MEQIEIKQKLLKNVKEGKTPNAICFIDKGGRGGLELASQLGLCILQNQDCVLKTSNYMHPDLHYIYPTKLPKEEKVFKKRMLAFYVDKWREFISTMIYDSFEGWLRFSSPDNKPGVIRVGQVEEAISVLSLKPFKSEKKVCIIWGLDYLKEVAGNKLLKILEEPPSGACFFLIAKNEKKILPTIGSRCQIIRLPPLGEKEILNNLIEMGFDASQASDASKSSNGDLNDGVSKIIHKGVIKKREGLFIDCLRVCYIAVARGDLSHLVKKSSELGSLSKSDLKEFFLFGIDFLRQSFFCSQNVEGLFEFKSMNNFSIKNFAPYVNNGNYKSLISLFETNLNNIDRNANIKLLATSFLLDFSAILYSKS